MLFILAIEITKLNAKGYSAGKLHFLNARNDTCDAESNLYLVPYFMFKKKKIEIYC